MAAPAARTAAAPAARRAGAPAARRAELDLLEGRVLRIVAGTYHVQTPHDALECSLRGRLKLREASGVAVGDRVRVERLEDGSCRILELVPRTSALTRHGVARRREQVIVANVDQVAAVAAVTDPEPDFGMLDRLLVLAELNELAARVVLNKWDRWAGSELSGAPAEGAGAGGRRSGGDESGEARGIDDGPLPAGFAPYRAAGYEILRTSATEGTGLDALRERLRGRTTVLSGQSGTGKSSLVNALLPGLEVRVGEVGARSGRGRHTTVAAALYPFPGSGYVADTPGLQYLALWEVEPAALTHAFPELRSPAERCRFADCRHRREPACAVREAVAESAVSERRYESYLRLLEEAEGGGR